MIFLKEQFQNFWTLIPDIIALKTAQENGSENYRKFKMKSYLNRGNIKPFIIVLHY